MRPIMFSLYSCRMEFIRATDSVSSIIMLSIAILSSISASHAKLPHQLAIRLYAVRNTFFSQISLLPLNAAAKSLSTRDRQRRSCFLCNSASASSISFCVRFLKSHRQENSSARYNLNKVILSFRIRFVYANIRADTNACIKTCVTNISR